MFTGIVETTGFVKKIEPEKSNLIFTIESSISNELKIDQSVMHNGVCLTVINSNNGTHQVAAIQETLTKTNLGKINVGQSVNLERCLPANGRFDGHIVQGHVDGTAKLVKIDDAYGSYNLFFEFDSKLGFTVSKGSVCLNGISLTVVQSEAGKLSVSIIPYTWENTNLRELQIGEFVNIEFDILGKYMEAILNRKK